MEPWKKLKDEKEVLLDRWLEAHLEEKARLALDWVRLKEKLEDAEQRSAAPHLRDA